MSGCYSFSCLFIALLASVCFAAHDHDLDCPATPICPSSESLSAVCHFHTDDEATEWKILDISGNSIDSVISNSTSPVGTTQSLMVAGVLIAINKSESALSVASFPASLSLDGYSLVCTNYITMNVTKSKNCSIDIDETPPSVPGNFSFNMDTITDKSVVVNWTSVSDSCNDGYRVWIYNNGVAEGPPRDLGPLETGYAVGLGNGTSSSQRSIAVASVRSDDVLSAPTTRLNITFDAPLPVINIRPMYTVPATDTPPMTLVINVTIFWTVQQSSRPRTRRYFITHNLTHYLPAANSGSGCGNSRGMDDDGVISTQLVTVTRQGMMDRIRLQGYAGGTYYISIVPSNALGNGTAASHVFTINPSPTPTSTSKPTPTVIVSPTVIDGPVAAAVAISVPITAVLTAVVTSIVSSLVTYYCCWLKSKGRSNSYSPSGPYDIPPGGGGGGVVPTGGGLELKDNMAYGQVTGGSGPPPIPAEYETVHSRN